MSPSQFFVYLCVSLSLLGCASMKVETTGVAPKQPLCQPNGESLSVLVLWGPQWRPDQKEVPLREAAARRGIEQFFAESACYSQAAFLRFVGDRTASTLTDEDVLRLATTYHPTPSRSVLIKVRELGPIIKLLGSPALVEGGTEVVLEIRVLNVATDESLANFRIHWQNGGAFVIKGVTTLDQDMRSALQAALQPLPVSQ